jgi:hypothetical protein
LAPQSNASRAAAWALTSARRAHLPRAWLPLVLLVAAGILLRALAMGAYTPAVLDNPDSGRYLFWAEPGHGVLGGTFAPAGYPAFLWLAHLVSDRLELAVALQHLLGVVTAILLYLCAGRVGAPRWVALAPAAVVLLSGDQVYLEHALLSEALFTAATAGALYAAARSLDGGWAWPVAAGGLLAAATLVRSAGLALVPVLALWAAFLPSHPWRGRLAAASAVTLGALLPIAVYVAGAAALDRPSGLNDIAGWHLYARVAPFADCSRFEPPPGTAAVCEEAPLGARRGPSYYLTSVDSPGRKAFGAPPRGDAQLAAFARGVIAGQPLDYAKAVGSDLVRVADPAFGSPPLSSRGGLESISFEFRNRAAERAVEQRAGRSYEGVPTRTRDGLSELASYQRLTRLDGWTLPALAVLAVIGAVRAAARLRAGIALLGLAALALYLTPAATAGYAARFGVPPLGPLTGAGALGAWVLLRSSRGADRAGRPLPLGLLVRRRAPRADTARPQRPMRPRGRGGRSAR